MSPGLRERGPGIRPDDELKRNRRNVFILGATFLFGMLLGGQSSWFSSGIRSELGDHDRRPAVIGAQSLFEAYRDDAEEADDRFDHRFMVVTGEFVGIVPDGQGHPDLRLRTSDPAMPLGADLVESSHAQSARLRPGQIVTVGCERMAATGDEHWLQDCEIETVAPGSAAPSGEEAPAPAEAGRAVAAEKGQPAPAE